jgi:alpha-1,3-rhamnosyl/mannosyltransferase
MPYWVKAPTLLTVHDLIPIERPEYSSWRARLFFRLAMRLALWRSHGVISVSQSTLEDLQREFPNPASYVRIIPEAPDPIFYPRPGHSVEDVRERYGLPERFVLYVGSNKPHKNLTRLVEAWAQVVAEHPEAVLVIAGRWLPDYEEPRIRAQVLGLEAPALQWLGPIPGEDLPLLYTAATLFVFPSLYEGFGLPPLEAMACGTPVACADVSSLPEVVGDAAVLFDPTETASIAEALIELWSNANLRMDLWARGIRRAQRFTWEDTARQTLDVYRQIVGSTGAGAPG